MYREQIDRFFEENKENMLSDLERLVNIRSVREEAKEGKPFGEGPAKVLAEAVKVIAEHSLNVKNFDNYVVTAEAGPQPAELGILAHLDVVPEGKGWETDPYKMVRKDGFIYGRGVSDDKGPAIAGLYAILAAQKIASFKKGVRLILGSAEETGSEDLRAYFKMEAAPPFSFSPDASYPVINIEKGGHGPVFSMKWEKSCAVPRVSSLHGEKTANIVPMESEADVTGLKASDIKALAEKTEEKTGVKFTLSDTEAGVHILAVGLSAHASTPELGKNALQAMLELLTALPLADLPSAKALKDLNRLFPYGDYNGKSLGIAQEDELSGKLTLNFSICDLDEEGFTARYDSRCPLCATKENVADVVEKAFTACGFELARNVMRPPHHVPEELPFVQTLLRVYEDYTGEKGECIAIGGGTYAHSIEGSVAFGCEMPGHEYHIHGANEVNSIDELLLGAKMFTQIILDMCC
ncbi:MAG: Sapep family Mn(2+)-dependent dipeptidase [Firmicutes bacterium]|nr:Sapep family Mn(2+)-dependent dipeptidase [Bacillota bacterium]